MIVLWDHVSNQCNHHAHDFPVAIPKNYKVQHESNLCRYYKEPGWLYSSKSPMRTIVMVSMRAIRNEELYLK
jgi:hypothetical protein